MGETSRPEYLSCLLRMWCVDSAATPGDNGEIVWRASLESSFTGERIGFASQEALFAFLWQQTGATSEADNDREVIKV
jgi:hypothetical protein